MWPNLIRDFENGATRRASTRGSCGAMDDDGDRGARDEDDRAKTGRQVRMAGRGASEGEYIIGGSGAYECRRGGVSGNKSSDISDNPDEMRGDVVGIGDGDRGVD